MEQCPSRSHLQERWVWFPNIFHLHNILDFVLHTIHSITNTSHFDITKIRLHVLIVCRGLRLVALAAVSPGLSSGSVGSRGGRHGDAVRMWPDAHYLQSGGTGHAKQPDRFISFKYAMITLSHTFSCLHSNVYYPLVVHTVSVRELWALIVDMRLQGNMSREQFVKSTKYLAIGTLIHSHTMAGCSLI